MNRYRSPMAVYLDKIGQLPEIEDNEFMYWGRVLEDTVANEFSIRTNIKVRRANKMLQHPKYPYMIANVDRLIVGQNAGLECKTASEYAKEDWMGETVPKEYALQCHHYMAVTGMDRWYIAVLIGGNKFEWRVIERDEQIISNLIEIETNFWINHVTRRVPPGYGAHDTTLLSERYPRAQDNEKIDLTPFRNDVHGLIEAHDQLQNWKFTFEDYKNRIKGHMGDADLGYFNGELFCTWKNTTRSRQFKIKGAKD
jgi:putative phage-type endonuclease